MKVDGQQRFPGSAGWNFPWNVAQAPVCLFRLTQESAPVTGDSALYQVVFDTLSIDANSDMKGINPPYTRYEANVTGLYRMAASITLHNLESDHVQASMWIRTSGGASFSTG